MVQGGDTPMSRQQMVYEEEPLFIPFVKMLLFRKDESPIFLPTHKREVRFFDMDPLNDGPNGYTSSQNIYVGHPFCTRRTWRTYYHHQSKGRFPRSFFDWFCHE